MDPFEDCLTKGRLKKVETGSDKAIAELREALAELSRSRSRYGGGNWAEAATQGYFAIYKGGRAALFYRGFRDTNLYGLCTGLQRLFVDTGEIPGESIEIIRDAKEIKDVIYEGGRSSRHEARQMVLAAQIFLKRILTALKLEGFEPESLDVTLPEVEERPRNRPPFPRDSYNR